MPYDVYTRNKRTLDNIYNRKVFKKHVFILNNTEGYFWDDYGISHICREKTPQKHFTTSSTQTPNQSSTSSTQTTNHSSTSSTQTTPIFSTTAATQTSNQSSTSSTQTEQQKENKFSLFKCLLFIVLNSLSRISSL